ncbi:MAG TPA: hypothetical protein VGD62_00205, partial [Acidobacteriaceae bacterium]
QSAANDFSQTIRLANDAHLLAWSHIYLGRIHDVQEERDQAVAEYQAALGARDGQQDTRTAAQLGLQQPYALPHREHAGAQDPDDDPPPAQPPATPAPNPPAPLPHP